MATIYAIPERTQSKAAMRGVMRYVVQDKKTLYEKDGHAYNLISGQNCVAESSFEEFMATKMQYGKDCGVFFRHYCQSFKPNENATPDDIHQMGVELAKYFDGFEVLVATHIDKDHWHNHLVVNSVNAQTGLKIQFNEKNLEQFRTLSDEICQAHGLEILQQYQKPKVAGVNSREFRAASRGDSFKFKLMSTIDKCLKNSNTKEQFIRNMKKLDYSVKWESHYKYITYTTPEGQKCRDNKLHEEKYLKTNMEVLLNGFEQTEATQRNNSRGFERTLRNESDGDTAGFMENNGELSERSGQVPDNSLCGYFQAANGTEFSGAYNGRSTASSPLCAGQYSGQSINDDEQDYGEDGQDGTESEFEDDEYIEQDDVGNENAGFDAVETQTKVGVNWGNIAFNTLALAASIENMVNDGNDKQRKKKKYVPRVEGARNKKYHRKSHGYGYEIER